MKKRKARNKVTRLTKKQQQATIRNWSKRCIYSCVKQCKYVRKNNSLNLTERMRVFKAQKILEEIVNNWTPIKSK